MPTPPAQRRYIRGLPIGSEGIDLRSHRFLRGTRRRLAWTLADQAASSLTNFALSIVVLRGTSIGGFGTFTIAYLTYQFVLRLVRALASQPLSIAYTNAPQDERLRAARSATGAGLILGTLASLGCIVAVVIFDGDLRAAFLGLAISLPGLMVQDVYRFFFFASARAGQAFINDVFWGVAQLAGAGVVIATQGGDVGWLVATWGLTGTAAAILGAIQARVISDPFATRAWLSEHRALGPRLAFEELIAKGAPQLSFFLIGAWVGLDALGGINGARTLFGPLNVIFLGAFAFAVPEGVRYREQHEDKFRIATIMLAAGLAGSAFAIVVLLILIPDSLGTRLVSESWTSLSRYILPVGVTVAAQGWMVAERIGLRVLALAWRSLRGQQKAGVAVIAGALAGIATRDASVAAWGVALGHVVGLVLYHGEFSAGVKTADRPSEHRTSIDTEEYA